MAGHLVPLRSLGEHVVLALGRLDGPFHHVLYREARFGVLDLVTSGLRRRIARCEELAAVLILADGDVVAADAFGLVDDLLLVAADERAQDRDFGDRVEWPGTLGGGPEVLHQLGSLVRPGREGEKGEHSAMEILKSEWYYTLPLAVIVIIAATMIIFLTELTSNIATTATFLPVVGAIAIESGFDPIVLTVPVTFAASCAFMLPVATPPNAIVFGSGMLTIPKMVRAGMMLNLVGIFLVSLVALYLAPKFL